MKMHPGVHCKGCRDIELLAAPIIITVIVTGSIAGREIAKYAREAINPLTLAVASFDVAVLLVMFIFMLRIGWRSRLGSSYQPFRTEAGERAAIWASRAESPELSSELDNVIQFPVHRMHDAS